MPTLNMGSAICWAWVLDCIKREKTDEHKHSSSSASWLQIRCDQWHQLVCDVPKPWANIPAFSFGLLFSEYLIIVIEKVTNTNSFCPSNTTEAGKTLSLVYRQACAQKAHVRAGRILPFLENFPEMFKMRRPSLYQLNAAINQAAFFPLCSSPWELE